MAVWIQDGCRLNGRYRMAQFVGYMHGLMHAGIQVEYADRRLVGWMDGRTDGRTDGWMDGWMDG